MSTLRTVYRSALRLYPRRFRALFADELVEILVRRVAGEPRRIRRVWLWLSALASCLRHGPAERLDEMRGSLASPSPQNDLGESSLGLGDRLLGMARALRLAMRSVARRPLVSVVIVFTLALGLGADVFLFAIVDAVLLRPPIYSEPDELVLVTNSYGNARTSSSPPDFMDRRESAATLDGVAAWREQDVAVIPLSEDGAGEAQQRSAARVTDGFFDVLGVRPHLGSIELPAPRGHSKATVLMSYRMWQRDFGGDTGILGRRLLIDGVAHTVEAVLPPGLDLPRHCELWLPLTFTPAQLAESFRPNEFLEIVARRRADVTLAAVRDEMNVLAARAIERQPERAAYLRRTDFGASVAPLEETLTGRVGPALTLLSAAVAVLLLLACSNVANLLLAQASVRGREMAVRRALGAGRVRLVGQMLAESSVLATAGGIVGLAAALLALHSIDRLVPADVPRLDQAGLDSRVLLFSVAATGLSTLLFGLLPALRAAAPSQLRSNVVLTGRSDRRWRRGLVVVEVALALLLLIGAGVLARSFRALTQIETGFAPAQRVALRVTLPPDWSGEESVSFHQRLRERLGAIPGVHRVALADHLPLSGSRWTATFRPSETDPDLTPGADIDIVSDGFFAVLEIPLLAGRDFAPTDRLDTPRVVIVDEATARRYLVGEGQSLDEALGHRVNIGDLESPVWREVVGVVGTVRMKDLSDRGSSQLWFAASQVPPTTFDLVLYTDRDLGVLTEPIRAALRNLDSTIPVGAIRSYERWVGQSIALERFQVRLLTGLASIALVLAGVGLYGVLAFSVARRRRELGLRLALGASAEKLVAGVVREGVGLTLVGALLGSLLSLGLIRILERLPWDIRTSDPVAWTGSIAILLLVSIFAAAIPARRAVQVDPARALRPD